MRRTDMGKKASRCLLLGLSAALLLPVLPVQAYSVMRTSSGAELHWPSWRIPVTYHLHSAGSADIHDGSDLAALEASFQTWEDVTCSSLAFNRAPDYSGTPQFSCHDGMNLVFWIESGWPAEVGAEAIGVTTPCFDNVTGEIVDADIWLNGAHFSWATDGRPNAVDVKNVATHEVGHFFGLGHSEYVDATMYYASAGNGETNKRTLTNDDEAGVCYLYPTDCVEDEDCVGDEVCIRNRCQPPPPAPSGLGDPCEFDEACVTGTGSEQAICLTEEEDGWAGGYCVVFLCDDQNPCPQGGECIVIGQDEYDNDVGVCLAGCNPQATPPGCRDDYICTSIDRDDSSKGICVPACRSDADCVDSYCDTTTGFCWNVQGDDSARVGDPCTRHEECPTGGGCLTEDDQDFLGGYCTKECDPSMPCPEGASCFTFSTEGGGTMGLCLDDCQAGQVGECRSGYGCWPSGQRDQETGAELGSCWIACQEDLNCSGDGSIVCNQDTGLCEPAEPEGPDNGNEEPGNGDEEPSNGDEKPGGGDNGSDSEASVGCGCAATGEGLGWPAFLLVLCLGLLCRRPR